MDYLARAMRVEEIPKLKQQYEEHLVQDKQFWEEQEAERVSDSVSMVTHYSSTFFDVQRSYMYVTVCFS